MFTRKSPTGLDRARRALDLADNARTNRQRKRALDAVRAASRRPRRAP